MRDRSAGVPLAILLIAGVIISSACLIPGCGTIPEPSVPGGDGPASLPPGPDAGNGDSTSPGIEPAPGPGPELTPAGDFDGDGVITEQDFQLLSAAFGAAEGAPNFDPMFDLDGDKEITLVDVQLFAALAE